MTIEETLKDLKINESVKAKILKIAQIRKSISPKIEDIELASRLANEVLVDIFKTPYHFVIPYEFIESEVGIMIFETKFEYQRYYSIFDIGIILKKSNSGLYYNNREGNLNLINKGGFYLATEGELRRYMKVEKKMKDEEIDRRLETFWSIKEKYLNKKGKKSEIKKLFEEEMEKG